MVSARVITCSVGAFPVPDFSWVNIETLNTDYQLPLLAGSLDMTTTNELLTGKHAKSPFGRKRTGNFSGGHSR